MFPSFKLQSLSILHYPSSSTFWYFEADADFLSFALKIRFDEAVAGIDDDLGRGEIAHLRTDLELLEARFCRSNASHVLRE